MVKWRYLNRLTSDNGFAPKPEGNWYSIGEAPWKSNKAHCQKRSAIYFILFENGKTTCPRLHGGEMKSHKEQ